MVKINIFSGARRIAFIVMLAWGAGVLVYFAHEAYYQALAEENLAAIEARARERSEKTARVAEAAKIRPRVREPLAAQGKLRPEDFGATQIKPEVPPPPPGFVLDKKRQFTEEEVWGKQADAPAVTRPSPYGFLSAFKLGWLIVAILGGWFVVWAFSYAVGWVIRGFFDIPMGRDHRTNEKLD